MALPSPALNPISPKKGIPNCPQALGQLATQSCRRVIRVAAFDPFLSLAG
jgi:hypothetical protein